MFTTLNKDKVFMTSH
jgi:nuclear protein localization family protein 4